MYKQESDVFKALSDPTRIQILELLIQGEACGCDLLQRVSVSQPTLSYHLSVLTRANLITYKPEGTKHHYHVNTNVLSNVIRFLNQIQFSTTTCEVSE